ncbi:NAD(P)-dependent oxidoreductase [bacterium]|nr:MAG: NAD(P)-dependent oxidoreductase [bacterium]
MIVITGAGGFLGHYVARELAGEKPLALTRSQLDVSRPESFDAIPDEPIEAFIHLAAVIPAKAADLKSDIFLRVNALGTFYALEFCRRRGVPKFILATTMWEATGHSWLPITETMGRRYAMAGDHTSYVISKIAAAEYVEHYRREYGIQGITLRMVGLLGYGRQPGAFEVFYEQAKRKQALEVWGEHSAKRDSLYVKDAARAVAAALRSPDAHGLYNISSGIGRTVQEEVKVFADIFDAPVVYRPEIPDKKHSYWFDNGKAARELGWVPQYNYHDIVLDYDKEATCH